MGAISDDEIAITESICVMDKKKRVAALLAKKASLQEEVANLRIERSSNRLSQSRGRSQDCYHLQCHYFSFNSSNDYAPSRKQCKRSKWTLKKFTKEHKDTKKLTSSLRHLAPLSSNSRTTL